MLTCSLYRRISINFNHGHCGLCKKLGPLSKNLMVFSLLVNFLFVKRRSQDRNIRDMKKKPMQSFDVNKVTFKAVLNNNK